MKNQNTQEWGEMVILLCVAKCIASNMLYFAVESAISDGVEWVYMHRTTARWVSSWFKWQALNY
ncbi:hypothetical protein CsatB_022044 [Cannabis sativa]